MQTGPSGRDDSGAESGSRRDLGKDRSWLREQHVQKSRGWEDLSCVWTRTAGAHEWRERGRREAVAGAQRGLDYTVGGGGEEMGWAMQFPLL